MELSESVSNVERIGDKSSEDGRPRNREVVDISVGTDSVDNCLWGDGGRKGFGSARIGGMSEPRLVIIPMQFSGGAVKGPW